MKRRDETQGSPGLKATANGAIAPSTQHTRLRFLETNRVARVLPSFSRTFPGRFAWPDWADRFSGTLARHGLTRDLDGGDDYFNAWLETLEALLAEDGAAEPGEVARLRAAWEAAYLRTPHGAPVHLDDGAAAPPD